MRDYRETKKEREREMKEKRQGSMKGAKNKA